MKLTPEKSIGYLIRNAGRAIRNRVTLNLRTVGVNLTMEQGAVLIMLGLRGQMSQKALAEFLGKDKTTIARIIDVMEKRSLLVRVQGEADKRVKMLVITQKGKEHRDLVEKAVLKTIGEATDGIPQKEVEKAMEVLKKVSQNLEHLPSEEAPPCN